MIDILYDIEYFMLPKPARYLMTRNVIRTAMVAGSFITWIRKARENHP